MDNNATTSDLLSTQEAADALHTSPQYLTRLKSRTGDFPEAVCATAAGKFYDRAAVRAWALNHGRPFGDETPQPEGSIDTAGILNLWGISRTRLAQIKAQAEDFPAVVAQVGRRLFYDRDAIVTWGRAHGRNA